MVKRWSNHVGHCFWQVASLQHHTGDPYDLSNEEEDHGQKDSTKTYRYGVQRPAVPPHFSPALAVECKHTRSFCLLSKSKSRCSAFEYKPGAAAQTHTHLFWAHFTACCGGTCLLYWWLIPSRIVFEVQMHQCFKGALSLSTSAHTGLPAAGGPLSFIQHARELSSSLVSCSFTFQSIYLLFLVSFHWFLPWHLSMCLPPPFPSLPVSIHLSFI